MRHLRKNLETKRKISGDSDTLSPYGNQGEGKFRKERVAKLLPPVVTVPLAMLEMILGVSMGKHF